MGIPAVGRCVKLCRMMSSSSSSRSEISAPWLKLYPGYKKKEYRFLRLQDDKVVRLDLEGQIPLNASKIVGSSHGWLALFNERNNDLFLSDPINGRHIKLPSIQTLPDPEIKLKLLGGGTVSKLILSCSPDQNENENECRAMIRYGVGSRLAICWPGRSTSWTPISSLMVDDGSTVNHHHAKVYGDFVYCSRRKFFMCLTPPFRVDIWGVRRQRGDENLSRLERWDTCGNWLGCCGHLPSAFYSLENRSPAWVDDDMERKLDDCPFQFSYLVYVESESESESDRLYLVVRYLDGYDTYFKDDPSFKYNVFFKNNPFFMGGEFGLGCYDYNPFSMNDPYVINKKNKFGPYKTVAFVVFKFDDELDDDEFDGGHLTAVDSLDGLAMFVGINHSFAISASKYPELNLKPNSIYFTDDDGGRFRGPFWNHSSKRYGGLDAGIFDYQNNIVSPPCNKKFLPTHHGSSRWIRHAPVWFTPRPKYS